MDASADLENLKAVYLPDLPPWTALLVSTMNSSYMVVATGGPNVYLQGGAFFPDPAIVLIGRVGQPGAPDAGWIDVGLRMEIRGAGRHVVTSRIRAIAADHPTDWRKAER